jgi:hypothetical protein
MKIKLTEKQVQALKNMNNYWEEISKRDGYGALVSQEFQQLFSAIDGMKILLIVGDYAKNYKEQDDINKESLENLGVFTKALDEAFKED